MMSQGVYYGPSGASPQHAAMDCNQPWQRNGPSVSHYPVESPYVMMHSPSDMPSLLYNTPPIHVNPTLKQHAKVPLGRLSITTCTQCQHVNYTAQSELERMDKYTEELKSEIESLKSKVQELEGRLYEQQTAKKGVSSRENNTVDSLIRTSKLSVDAEEFNPKAVPVVSAKGIEEENMQMSPAMAAKSDCNAAGISCDEVYDEKTSGNVNISDDNWKKTCKNSEACVKTETELQASEESWNKITEGSGRNTSVDCYEAEIVPNVRNSNLGVQNNSHKRKGSDIGSKQKEQDSKGKNLKKNSQYESQPQRNTYTPNSKHERSGHIEDMQRDRRTPKQSYSEQSSRSSLGEMPLGRRSEGTGGTSKRGHDTTQKPPRGNRSFDAPRRKSNPSESENWRYPQDFRKNTQSQDYKDGESMKNLKYILNELKGDLFTAPPEYSLAHCVAEDFRMGSGIAVRFKKEFKRTGELLDQQVRTGGCAYLEDKKNSRYIFYLVTKPLSNLKPTYKTLTMSLEALKEKCLKLNVTKLAIPYIGCGLDKLDWEEVKWIINRVFYDSSIDIRVYDFNEEGLPEAEGNKPKGSAGVYVKYEVMELKTLEPPSGLLFFGTEDGHVDSTVKSLNEKVNFLADYKSAEKIVGSVWTHKKSKEYYVYGLIVQKSFVKNGVAFTDVDNCCRELMKLCRSDVTEYVGIECLAEWSDHPLFTEKVVTMLRHYLNRPTKELWVCFRNEKDNIHNDQNKNRDLYPGV